MICTLWLAPLVVSSPTLVNGGEWKSFHSAQEQSETSPAYLAWLIPLSLIPSLTLGLVYFFAHRKEKEIEEIKKAQSLRQDQPEWVDQTINLKIDAKNPRQK